MARIGREQASQVETMEGFEGRYEELGGYTAGFEKYTEDADPSPLFQGLLNDRCQCPHWGVVVRGTLIYEYGDGSRDVITAGEAYYAPPDHTPRFTAGTEISPTAELSVTMQTVLANLAVPGGSA